MKTVTRCVDLKKFDVTVRNTRQTRTGGTLLEVDSPKGVITLAEKVRQAVAGKARMTRPKRRTPALLLGVFSGTDEADERRKLATFDVTPAKSAKMSLKGDAIAET